jgi:hypothetical protein
VQSLGLDGPFQVQMQLGFGKLQQVVAQVLSVPARCMMEAGRLDVAFEEVSP